MKKRVHLTILVMASVVFLAACGSSAEDAEGTSDPEETYKVGATQIVEHPSLDRAYEGFQAAIKEAGIDVEFDLQSAQGDQNNVKPIADNFVADDVDLIFANSTPSALGALQATSDLPIIFTSVTDAVDAGLIEDMEEPGDNITGVLDLHPDAIEKTVEFMDENFADSTVGLIYNAGEQNSVTQIEAIEEVVEGTSLSLVDRTVSNSSEVQQAATTLVEDVDVFYIITDNTVVSALDSVVGIANDHEIPLFVGEPDSLEVGGFATFGIDYYTMGYRTGEMAVDILTGEKTTQDFLVEYPPEIQLYMNKENADSQGVEWNEAWDEEAELVETE